MHVFESGPRGPTGGTDGSAVLSAKESRICLSQNDGAHPPDNAQADSEVECATGVACKNKIRKGDVTRFPVVGKFRTLVNARRR